MRDRVACSGTRATHTANPGHKRWAMSVGNPAVTSEGACCHGNLGIGNVRGCFHSNPTPAHTVYVELYGKDLSLNFSLSLSLFSTHQYVTLFVLTPTCLDFFFSFLSLSICPAPIPFPPGLHLFNVPTSLSNSPYSPRALEEACCVPCRRNPQEPLKPHRTLVQHPVHPL